MIYELDKSNISLALQELIELGLKPTLLQDNFYKGNSFSKPLGMTKAIYKEIKNIPKLSFKANSYIRSDKEFADSIWDKTSKHVDLKNPEIEIYEFKDFIAKKVWQRPNNKLRKSHYRKNNHPTTLDPNLAITMINLANTKKVFDPFCGSAGLLYEAKILKKEYYGIDIDKIQIKRAEELIEKKYLKNADSFKEQWPEVIVTDLPYGRNSKIQNNFFEKFFNKVKTCKKAVIGLPESIKTPKTKFETTIYLHKSLSKKIIILTH